MKVNLDTYSENDVEKTVATSRSMELSSHARTYIFKMFSSSIYSNPIGTVVREITSNCFDSHVEAGVNYPVLIKKSYNNATNTHFLSFVDYGVGISPQRMFEVCGVYFESTKGDSNDQIGGYGIGMKSPLAYKRLQSDSSFDNSYYVITNYNGVKYTYCIHEDNYSPVISLMHEEETSEINGTEVRIIVLEKDLKKFQYEIVRQLYYFDSLIFEGFDDSEITNDYTIVRCKNFIYRGHAYSNNMHICLGKVAYPIDYSALNISSSDYRLPVALKFNIGDINVTTSREAIEYSDASVELIKQKLNEAKQEIIKMISKQYENVVTLEDYYEYLKNFGTLHLTDEIHLDFNFIKAKDVKLPNYRYSNIKMPSDTELFRLFYETSPHGSKYNHRNSYQSFNGSLKRLNNGNVYLCDDTFKRKLSVLSYLKQVHPIYYTVRHKAFSVSEIKQVFDCYASDLVVNDEYTELYNTILDIYNEFSAIVRKNIKIYSEIVIPETFRYKREKHGKTSGEITINIVSNSNVNKQTLDFSKLYTFKGSIIYSAYDEIEKLKITSKIFNELFNPRASSVRSYRNWDKITPFYDKKEYNKVLFIAVAKNKLKTLKTIEGITHVDNIYNRFFYRKKDDVINNVNIIRLKESYESLDTFYTHHDLSAIFPDLAKKINQVHSFIYSEIANSVNSIVGNPYIYRAMDKYFGISSAPIPKIVKQHEKTLIEIHEISKKNAEILNCLRVPSYSFRNNETFCNLAKTVLTEK